MHVYYYTPESANQNFTTTDQRL